MLCEGRGYVTQAQVLDSMNFGGCAIQKKRLYVIGIKPTTSHPTRRFTWPKLFESSPRRPNITMSDVFDLPCEALRVPTDNMRARVTHPKPCQLEHYEATDGAIWRIDTHHAALMLGFDETHSITPGVALRSPQGAGHTVCPSLAAALVTQLRCVVLCVAGG